MTQCPTLSQLALRGSPTILSRGFSVISWLGNGDWGREKETPEASSTRSKGGKKEKSGIRLMSPLSQAFQFPSVKSPPHHERARGFLAWD